MDRNDIDKPTLEEPRLYVIVRRDLYDLNPGKLGAQTAHAGSKFVREIYTTDNFDDTEIEFLTEQYELWDAGRGFGTKITLTATREEILQTQTDLANMGLLTGVVVDPTYPFRNYFGEVFTAEELTCGYVFAPTDTPQEALDYLRKFPLHP